MRPSACDPRVGFRGWDVPGNRTFLLTAYARTNVVNVQRISLFCTASPQPDRRYADSRQV